MSFERYIDLASERLGGEVVGANDEFFAEKENLLRATTPVFVADKYTDRGKWMDGWETRRRRQPGHDWAIVRLALAGSVRVVVVDTSHFKGNYPEACSLDACAAPGDSTEALADAAWSEIMPRSRLSGDSQNRFEIRDCPRVTYVRLNIYPDGGVARLRLYGEVMPDWATLTGASELDLAAVQHGGRVLAQSDMFFGNAQSLLLPGAPTHMGDGWETQRRRGPGFDWVIVALGRRGTLERIEIDTTHFKGNAPDRCDVHVYDRAGATIESLSVNTGWRPVLENFALTPHHLHAVSVPAMAATHARLRIHPDGGVARLRLVGLPDA